jgi:hypothetical protein
MIAANYREEKGGRKKIRERLFPWIADLESTTEERIGRVSSGEEKKGVRKRERLSIYFFFFKAPEEKKGISLRT